MRTKAAGGRISSFIHLYFMDKAVQERRHAQASGGRVFLAKKRFRACKKIPVPLLWFVLLISGNMRRAYVLGCRERMW
ncbi:MAG: hypothetical protein DRN37_07995 [Thermoplasmata archaeon]|nr:MAG: hypothetical protein DRN37_07995 [Thermoplasmata archaeon]